MERADLDYVVAQVVEGLSNRVPVCQVFEANEIVFVKAFARSVGSVKKTALTTLVGVVVLFLLSALVAGVAAKLGWSWGK